MSESSLPRHTSPSENKRHRRVVVVQDTFRAADGPCGYKPSSSAGTSSPLEVPRQRQSASSVRISDPSSVHSVSSVGSIDTARALSPAVSNRSSQSSLVDASAGAMLLPSSSTEMLDELKRQIILSAARIKDLESAVCDVPRLNSVIEDLRKERGKIANDLLDQEKAVQSLKQRVTVLHEQNGQMAKVLKAESGGSDQLGAMRNTLFASLAQLKQLQEQANAIQPLKSQVRLLEEENSALREKEVELSKHLLERLPEGVTLAEYHKLKVEKEAVMSANTKLLEDCNQMRKKLSTITVSSDGLRKRIEVYESSQAQSSPQQEYIRRLEAEKDTLYQELSDIKFHQGASRDVEAAQLSMEAAQLRKANSQLKSRMERMRISSYQQKEQLALKLFEMEALNVRTQKYQLESQMLEMEQLHLKSELLQADVSVPLSPQSEAGLSEDSDVPGAGDMSPETKAQILSLQQLRVHTEQTKRVMQSLFTEREEMEKTISELSSKIQEKSITDLEARASQAEGMMTAARERIVTLEKELQSVLSASSQPSVALENQSLKSQLSVIKVEHDKCVHLQQHCRDMEENMRKHTGVVHEVEKLKEDKSKLDKKQKESRHRLKTLARELTGSVQLLQNFKAQCATQQKDIEALETERKFLREELATVKARMEVLELESTRASSRSPASRMVGLGYENTTVTEGDAGVSGGEKSHIDEELLSLRKVCDDLVSQVDLLNVTVQDKDAKLHEMSLKLESMEGERNTLIAASEQETRELNRVQQHISGLEANRQELQHQLNSVQKELSKAVASQQASDETLQSSQSKYQSASLEVASLNAEIAAAKSDVTKLSMARDQALIQLEEEKSKTAAISEKLCQKDSDLHEASQKAFSIKQLCLHLGDDINATCLESVVTPDKTRENPNSSDLDAVESMLIMLRREVQDLVQSRNKLLQEVKEQNKVHKEMEEVAAGRIAELTISHEASAGTSTEAVKRIAEQEAQLTNSRREISDLEHDKATVQQQFRVLQHEHEKEFDVLRQELSVCQSKLINVQAELQKSKQNARDEMERFRLANAKLQTERGTLERKSKSSLTYAMELEDKVRTLERRPKVSDELLSAKQELDATRKKADVLSNEVIAYQATVNSLKRQLDEAETREVEHEILRHKVRRLEMALGDSSQLKVDNKALLTMLQETVTHLPVLNDEVHQSLQEANLRLEQQVSVLSQWNDKQRVEIESLERRMEHLESEKRDLVMDIMAKEGRELENRQLKQELKEVESEVNTLRRQVRADLQEEMQVKLKTQSQILSVFNQHNTMLQKQVVELQEEVRRLGGKMRYDKPVSPPPMPDISEVDDGQFTVPKGPRMRTSSELQKENDIMRERVSKLEHELSFVQDLSATVRRRSSILSARSSVPVVPVSEDVHVSVPAEMLLPCSLLSDELSSGKSVIEVEKSERFAVVKQEWFECMAQETLSAACVQIYLTTVSRLSPQLLEVVIDLQDEQGNMALHYCAANGNWDAIGLFLKQRCCHPTQRNKAGYTPLMLSAISGVDGEEHMAIMRLLVTRGDINASTPMDGQTALMLAASSGSPVLTRVLLEAEANVNSQDKDGSTALMFACQNNHIEIVKLLITVCDVSVTDKDGLTALEISKKTGNKDLYSTLMKQSR